MHAILFSIVATISCAHMQLHGMHGPISLDESFRIYLQNDCPVINDLIIQDNNAHQCIRTLHEGIPIHAFTHDVSSIEYAKNLPKMSRDAIAARYSQYHSCWQEFIATIATKQILKSALKRESRGINFNRLSESFHYFERRMITLSTWLTAIRNSGEEHYVGIMKLKPALDPDHYERKEPTLFWLFTLRERILHNFKTSYAQHSSRDPLLSLNATSLTTLRHQLNNGFDHLRYKKTTEYTGPAICILKFAGKDPVYWPYKEVAKLLNLKEEIDLDTELLWQ